MKNKKNVSLKGTSGNCATVAKSKKKPTRKISLNQESSKALWNDDLDILNLDLSSISKNTEIIRYVDDKLHYTEDFSIFKKCDYNRDISIKGAKKIIEQVGRCGKWVHQPIIVNPKMEVISGQNTLVAAKLLGFGVNYIISEDRNPELLVGGEVKTNWKDLDSLKTYAKTNEISRKFYKFFIDVNKELREEKVKNSDGRMVKKYKNITLPQLLAIVYKQPKMVYGVKANGGAHLLNNLKNFQNKNRDINIAIKIVGLAQKECIVDGIKRYPFLVGLLEFMYANRHGIDVDFDRLLNKIPVTKVKAGKVEDYYNQIMKAYI